MSVVKRLADWPQAAERRSAARTVESGQERPSAEIIILPCVRRERPESRTMEAMPA